MTIVPRRIAALAMVGLAEEGGIQADARCRLIFSNRASSSSSEMSGGQP
jgi:hypothetical protein